METPEVGEEIHKLTAEITPEKIVSLVRELIVEDLAENPKSVAVYKLVDRLLAGRDYDTVTRAQLAVPLREAISKIVSRIPGMKYVEGG